MKATRTSMSVRLVLGVLIACGGAVVPAMAGQGSGSNAPPKPNQDVHFAMPGGNGMHVGGDQKVDRSWRHEGHNLQQLKRWRERQKTSKKGGQTPRKQQTS